MRTIVNARRPAGFTLVELSIVILIIGLLLTFVLAAAAAGLESARVRATQALITKLSVGLEERLEAVLSQGAEPNAAHRYLGSIYLPNYASTLPWGLKGEQRAQVIARLDQIRREFPDVFVIDPAVINGGTKGLYPIRFGGLPYPDPTDSSAGLANYVLPLGHMVTPDYAPGTRAANGTALRLGPGAQPPVAAGRPLINSPGNAQGINGASYSAAASLYRLIGYTPKGCDGVDNDTDPSSPGYGFVDDYLEGISDPNESSGSNKEASDKVETFLANHRHKTARSEMLYALLVEGLGPLGSVFSSEDFRDTEVRDTDEDGVPEFVDGWGEPLQFFRWPFAHESPLQKGAALYDGPTEPRQQNPFDPNNQLTSIAWWTTDDPTNPAQPSMKCLTVQNLLAPLADPNWVSGTPNPQLMWDRSGATGRRAYMVKFLIVSGGPDREVAIPRMGDIQVRAASATAFQLAQAITGQVGYSNGAFTFVAGESWAMPLPWGTDGTLAQGNLPSWAPTPYQPYLDTDYSLDDISNQEIQNRAGGFQ